VAQTPKLKRSLSLGLLTLYGLGTTIGARIFVLIGKVAGAGGELAPFSFLLAATIAGLSVLSFAEFASRFPESAGEAVYVKEGLNSSALALVVGLTVTAAGIVSTATIIVGFSGYLADVTAVPRNGAQVAMTLLLAAIAMWGIRASVSVAALVTLIEIGVLVVILGFGVLGSSGVPPPEPPIAVRCPVDGCLVGYDLRGASGVLCLHRLRRYRQLRRRNPGCQPCRPKIDHVDACRDDLALRRDCAPCPTGAIDSFRMIAEPWPIEEQFGCESLPDDQVLAQPQSQEIPEDVARITEISSERSGGRELPPLSAPHQAPASALRRFGRRFLRPCTEKYPPPRD